MTLMLRLSLCLLLLALLASSCESIVCPGIILCGSDPFLVIVHDADEPLPDGYYLFEFSTRNVYDKTVTEEVKCMFGQQKLDCDDDSEAYAVGSNIDGSVFEVFASIPRALTVRVSFNTEQLLGEKTWDPIVAEEYTYGSGHCAQTCDGEVHLEMTIDAFH